eukprot:scaffold48746_cov15-Tisochrysis_lutea.AAC.1
MALVPVPCRRAWLAEAAATVAASNIKKPAHAKLVQLVQGNEQSSVLRLPPSVLSAARTHDCIRHLMPYAKGDHQLGLADITSKHVHHYPFHLCCLRKGNVSYNPWNAPTNSQNVYRKSAQQ